MQSSTSHGFRLSPQQRQIWNSQQAFPDQTLRVVASFVVEGKLDGVRQALTAVVSRNEIVRTTFVGPAALKGPFQVIADEPDFFWRNEDLRSVDDAQRQ